MIQKLLGAALLMVSGVCIGVGIGATMPTRLVRNHRCHAWCPVCLACDVRDWLGDLLAR